MSHWKEYPHLFANGRFKMKVKDTFQCEPIHGAIRGQDDYWWLIPTSSDYSYDIDDSQLIARPIEDMTDEEIEKLIRAESPHVQGLQYQVSDLKDDIRELCRNGHLTRDQFLNLLSIGVYPFDQSHFGDTVIDATKTEAL